MPVPHERQVARNRRRRGFELLGPRHMTPALCGAIVAATILHYCGFKLIPVIFPYDFIPSAVVKETPNDDRTFVRFQEDKTEPELSKEPEIEQPAEIQENLDEPQEIDLVDMPIEELTIAPGETSLSLPSPVPASEDTLAPPMPTHLDLSSVAPAPSSLQESALPEPAPVTNNPVTINARPLNADTDPEQWIRDELKRRQAEENVPGGTRSLSDLLKIANPGAGSGAARLGADLIFSFNKAELKASARISLLQLAALIHKNPKTKFIIEGHTDSIGSEPYNVLLSLQRANAVRQWLKENGIPMKNVYIRPCGSRSPLVSTKGDRNAQRANRRVEIHMRKPTEKLPSGCLDASFTVDMKTPIAEQLRKGVKLPGAQTTLLQNPRATTETPQPTNTPSSAPTVRQPSQNTGEAHIASGLTPSLNKNTTVADTPPTTPTPQRTVATPPSSNTDLVAEEVPDTATEEDFTPTAAEVPDDDPIADEVTE